MKFHLLDDQLEPLVAEAADPRRLESVVGALKCWAILNPSSAVNNAYWAVLQLTPKTSPELYALWQKIKALRSRPYTLENYCELLHLGWLCAQEKAAHSLTFYHNRERNLNADDLYNEIRSRLLKYSSSAEELCQAVTRELSSLIATPRHCPEKDYLDEMCRVLSVLFQVEKRDGVICFSHAGGQHVVQLEQVPPHVGSETVWFDLNNINYYVILLAYSSSFYHELGHVVEFVLSPSNENQHCGETIAVIFERLEPKPILALDALTTGFDYFINDYAFPNVPSADQVVQLFSDYLIFLFPNLQPSVQTCFLLDDNLYQNTGRLADYLEGYLTGQRILPGSTFNLVDLPKIASFYQNSDFKDI